MDFSKELEKYNFLEMDDKIEIPQDETAVLLNTFNSNIKRLSKEQNKANMVMEELFLMAEEDSLSDKGSQAHIDALKSERLKLETENHKLKNLVVTIMDQIEIMYRGISSDSNQPIAKEVKKIWDGMKESLPIAGITVIDKDKIPYNSQIHTVIETRQEEEYENYFVLDIVKCGYIFENGDVRKAKIIANKLDK